MILDRDAFNPSERARRTLAAQDRRGDVRAVFAGYHDWDWQAALLADLLLTGMIMAGDESATLEMDIVRAEPVAGVRVQGGALATWRQRFPRDRTMLRDRSEKPFFDFGRYCGA